MTEKVTTMVRCARAGLARASNQTQPNHRACTVWAGASAESREAHDETDGGTPTGLQTQGSKQASIGGSPEKLELPMEE